MTKPMLVTAPAPLIAKQIVRFARQQYPALHIVTRSQSMEQMEMFSKEGVYHVVQPEFEAGLEFTRQALLHLDLPLDRIQHFTDEFRHTHYRPLYDMTAGYTDMSQLQNAAGLLRLSWTTLDMNNAMVGKTIAQLDIRNHTGATVAGVMRGGRMVTNPSPGFVFQKGDMVGVLGTTDQLAQFETMPGVSE
ncbi:MAG: hypothetical protein MI862_12480 [Desulfobacterales bacterium]|nr:hypothetical protein [Desulfobacterales bacterium]